MGHLADVPGHNRPATELRRVDGDVTSRRDGEVIEGLEVMGSIVIEHDDVTVRRNRVHGSGKAEGGPAYVAWNTIGKVHGDEERVSGRGRGRDVHFNRFDLFLFRGYEWSGAERSSRQVRLSPVPVARDAVGVFPAAAPMTSGFLFQNTNGRIDDVLVQGNHFDGDVYRYLSFNRARASTGPTDVRILDNTFVRRYPAFGRSQLIGADDPGHITWAGNVDEAGEAIAPVRGMKRR